MPLTFQALTKVKSPKRLPQFLSNSSQEFFCIPQAQLLCQDSRTVAGLEQAAHSKWNATDSGSLYKLFEQRRSWSDADSHCQSFDARLAIIDSEAKNNYIKGLFRDKPNVDYVWIGMKTASSQPSSQATFSNFDKQNPVDGCAVMNRAGVWSIRSCDQLHSFVCQMVVLRK
ncbi:hypothetical protein Y032_0071g520 [Ancylostoma ceylanicum]|uniref:C-type lectin domain-containing protein n=1 Tax=Ancylostoma ceylanicum TaxID=53326 RepID=A0A016TWP6_9BILA|nr:hypothetical protein Y032_0071g520 [Ancylostoma ceylanicum]